MLTTRYTRACDTLADLQEMLAFCADLARRHPSTIYLAPGLTFSLVEKTLTDGSTVFDIRPSAASDADTCPLCGAEHTE